MTIAFVHSGKAFLPEIAAYTRFLEPLGYTCINALPEQIENLETDVEWHFMGLDRTKARKGRIKIHEYASSSVGSLSALRNLSKKVMSVRPDYRIFLNPFVKESFGFRDNVPFGYRDMGIDAAWINSAGARSMEFKYDFVYIGDLSEARQPERLLEVFANGTMRNKTLLLISGNYAKLKERYKGASNIIFEGPYNHSLIPSLLRQAQYGINYIIDNSPYNRQTSTKFLEYAACGLPIISTQYEWIEEFQAKYGGRYYYLQANLSNFEWDKIKNYTFAAPELSEWIWENQIRASGILDFLKGKINRTL